MLRALPTFALALVLGACGPPLGKYQLAAVSLVDSAEYNAREYAQIDAPRLLRIELLSQTNLAGTKGIVPGNVYVFADFCPWASGDIMLLGPSSGDRSGLEPPFWDASRKAFVYVAYLKPYQQARPASPGYDRIKGYDLRKDARDLCLRMQQVGYFATASQSDVVVVPRAAIATALAPKK